MSKLNLSAERRGVVGCALLSEITSTAGTRYYYRVRASHANGFTPYTNVASVTPTGYAPAREFANISPPAAGLARAAPGDRIEPSFNEKTDILYADLAVRNIGQYLIDQAIFVGIDNISDPSVRQPDGFTADGIPYYDFSDLVADGTLSPDELSAFRTIEFQPQPGAVHVRPRPAWPAQPAADVLHDAHRSGARGSALPLRCRRRRSQRR